MIQFTLGLKGPEGPGVTAAQTQITSPHVRLSVCLSVMSVTPTQQGGGVTPNLSPLKRVRRR